jgi:single-strand DNA-binding protein
MRLNNGINKVLLVGQIFKNRGPQNQNNDKKYSYFQFRTIESGVKKGEETEFVEYHKVKIPAYLPFDEKVLLDEGQLIWLEGKLQTKGAIGADGVKRYLTEIVVSRYDLLG